MTNIDQNGPKSNRANETKGEDGGGAQSAKETAHIEEALEAIDGPAASDEAHAQTEEGLRARDETAASTEETALASSARGLTALAWLRTYLGEHGMHMGVAGVLSTLEQAIRRPHTTHTEEETSPASAKRRAGGDDDEPPTSRLLPPPLSTLAVRLNDGAMLASLEDAADRDLSGREVITLLVLVADEIERARETIDDALSDAAASIIGRLPMRPT